jgi:mannose-6-phosphate isomerase-like protein (cupin superfamily)
MATSEPATTPEQARDLDDAAALGSSSEAKLWRSPRPARASLRAAQRNKARRWPFLLGRDTLAVYEERWPMTTDPPTSAQPLWYFDNLVYIHVDGEQYGGAYSLSETWGARGNMPPLHVHRRNDETFYILEGDVRLFVGDREVVLAPVKRRLLRAASRTPTGSNPTEPVGS